MEFQHEIERTFDRYWTNKEAKLDLISALPFDLILSLFLEQHSWMRLNRMLKYNSFFNFNEKIIRLINNGSLYQIGVVTFYLLYTIHLDACLYYQVRFQESKNL